MPSCACSNLPRRPRTPVAVRSSMPKSSASSSVSTIAAQLTATNGRPPPPTQLVDLSRDQLLAGPAFAFDEDGEIGGGDFLDPIAHDANLGAGSDERRRAVGPASRAERPAPGRALDLDEQPGNLRGGGEHLPGRAVGRTRRIEDGLQTRPAVDGRDRHFVRHDVRAVGRLAVFAKRDGAGAQQHAKLLLEALAYEPRLPDRRQTACQRRNQRRRRTSCLRRGPVGRGTGVLSHQSSFPPDELCVNKRDANRSQL